MESETPVERYKTIEPITGDVVSVTTYPSVDAKIQEWTDRAGEVMPKRIQMTRQRPWRADNPDAVRVDRTTKWGNPFRRDGLACVPGAMTGSDWEYEDRISAPGQRHDFFHADDRVTRCEIRELTRDEVVLLFREQLTGNGSHLRGHSARRAGLRWRGERVTVADVRAELAGRDLACWCPVGMPCHADVLLEIANA